MAAKTCVHEIPSSESTTSGVLFREWSVTAVSPNTIDGDLGWGSGVGDVWDERVEHDMDMEWRRQNPQRGDFSLRWEYDKVRKQDIRRNTSRLTSSGIHCNT